MKSVLYILPSSFLFCVFVSACYSNINSYVISVPIGDAHRLFGALPLFKVGRKMEMERRIWYKSDRVYIPDPPYYIH
jgi:hypothetical protein